MSVVRDRLWIWGHEAGSHNDRYGLSGSSRMTPAEGALYLGVPNLIMVRYDDLPGPPFDQYARALSPLSRVVWSIVGAGGRTEQDEVAIAVDLASRFPNICGVMMDDFFRSGDAEGGIGVFDSEMLVDLRGRLTADGRKLDLWVVLYRHNLDPSVREHLAQCDVVAFWTWRAEELDALDQSFEEVECLAPSSRKVLGCYMWDYGAGKPMPVSSMEHQCRTGLRWLQEGRIEGMIFLASCICDLDLEAVEWTRRWIQEVGDMELEAGG